MALKWDERERKREGDILRAYRPSYSAQARNDLFIKTVSPRDCICYDSKSGKGCTLREEHEVGETYGFYHLRLPATKAEIMIVNDALESGIIRPLLYVDVKSDKCDHGSTYLEVYRPNYLREMDTKFVAEVRRVATEISRLLMLELKR